MLYRHDICAVSSFFFSNDTATTEIYTLSLHDALPIWDPRAHRQRRLWVEIDQQYPLAESLEANAKIEGRGRLPDPQDRKSTRLNSSHMSISYAVFCLKKKNQTNNVICI